MTTKTRGPKGGGYDDVAYIKRTGREGQNPRTIYKGNRRQAGAALSIEGLSQRRIAERLGIGKSTVARDLKYLRSSEHQVRAQETAAEIVEGEFSVEIANDIPTNVKEFRDQERTNVIKFIAQKHTYEQTAIHLGISIDTVIRHINSYLAEYGDWGGRTMQDWRNEQLIKSYQMLQRLESEMDTEPIVGYDAMGDEKGWDLTPYQAGKMRSDARKEYMIALRHQAKLLQLLVSKTEIEVEQKVMVVKLRNVDLSMFPEQDSPRLIGG